MVFFNIECLTFMCKAFFCCIFKLAHEADANKYWDGVLKIKGCMSIK